MATSDLDRSVLSGDFWKGCERERDLALKALKSGLSLDQLFSEEFSAVLSRSATSTVKPPQRPR